MTSSSSLGSASVALQFDINRNIDAAARDVQASIKRGAQPVAGLSAAESQYRKANPAKRRS